MKHILCLLGLHRYYDYTDIIPGSCIEQVTTKCTYCFKQTRAIGRARDHTWIYDDTQDTQTDSAISSFECGVTTVTARGIKCARCEVKNRRFIIKPPDGVEYYMDSEIA